MTNKECSKQRAQIDQCHIRCLHVSSSGDGEVNAEILGWGSEDVWQVVYLL